MTKDVADTREHVRVAKYHVDCLSDIAHTAHGSSRPYERICRLLRIVMVMFESGG
jgi:hypothetical protein